MGRKKITIEQLRAEVDKIVEEYADDAFECVKRAATQYGKIAQRELKEQSPKRTGKYSKGWAYTREGTSKRDNVVSVTVHNKAAPGLTHLLEKGHAKRNGGRVPGQPHIEPVEAEINKDFVDTVVSEIGSL